jgi:hypothetical protein
VVRLATEHPELGADFTAWLSEYVAEGLPSRGGAVA